MAKNTYTPFIKYGTKADWEKAKNFTPQLGTIIIYTDMTPPGVKYGDGIKNVNDLSFINENKIDINKDTLVIK